MTAFPKLNRQKSRIDETHPRWSQLPPDIRALVGNGCGSKGGWLRPPNFMFEASCDQHDFYYLRGATEGDRIAADDAFLRAMLRDAALTGWWVRWLNRRIARTYAWAVSKYGKSHFSYREFPMTWDDLNAHVFVQRKLTAYRENRDA